MKSLEYTYLVFIPRLGVKQAFQNLLRASITWALKKRQAPAGSVLSSTLQWWNAQFVPCFPPPVQHTWTPATHLCNVPGTIWPGISCPVNRDVKQARWKEGTPRNRARLEPKSGRSRDDYSLGRYKERKMTCYRLAVTWCLQQSWLVLILASHPREDSELRWS